MKKNKKAQFYFIAVIVLVSVFLGLVTLRNSAILPHQAGLIPDKGELDTEISSLFDYLSHEQIVDQKLVLTNFSNLYIQKIGENKDTFFIFGNNNLLTLVGNKLDETTLSIDYGLGNESISDNGNFQKDYSFSWDQVNLTLDGIEHEFIFQEGENLYYLIKYVYNNQTFIIEG